MGGFVSLQDDLYPLPENDSFVWNKGEPFVFIVQQPYRRYETKVKQKIQKPTEQSDVKILGWIPLFTGPSECLLWLQCDKFQMNAFVFQTGHTRYQLAAPTHLSTRNHINASELFHVEKSLLWVPLPHFGFHDAFRSMWLPLKIGTELYRSPTTKVVFCGACNLVNDNTQCIWIKEYNLRDSIVCNRVHAIGEKVPFFVVESTKRQIPRKIELDVDLKEVRKYGEEMQISDEGRKMSYDKIVALAKAYFGCAKVWLETKKSKVNIIANDIESDDLSKTIDSYTPELVKGSMFDLSIHVYYIAKSKSILVIVFTKEVQNENVLLISHDFIETNQWSDKLIKNAITVHKVYLSHKELSIRLLQTLALIEKIIMSKGIRNNMYLTRMLKSVGIDNRTTKELESTFNPLRRRQLVLFKNFINKLTDENHISPLYSDYLQDICWPFSTKPKRKRDYEKKRTPADETIGNRSKRLANRDSIDQSTDDQSDVSSVMSSLMDVDYDFEDIY